MKPLVEKLEGVYKKMPQEFGEHPVEAFRRNVYVNPFWEDALEGLIEIMTPDRLLFGSDYPPPRGPRQPHQLLRRPAVVAVAGRPRPRSWAATSRNCWRSDRRPEAAIVAVTGASEEVGAVATASLRQ